MNSMKELKGSFQIKPKKLNVLLKPTELCNLRCVYCFDKEAQKKVKPKVMSMETFRK